MWSSLPSSICDSHGIQQLTPPSTYYFLPTDAKAAAEVLGYTQAIWDSDKDPETVSDSDYDELDADEQKAAAVLGYDKASWDAS